VIKAMDKDLFEIVMLGITQEGQFILYTGSVEKLLDNTWESDENCNRDVHLFNSDFTDSIDIFFPVLHGTNGEDGTIQGVFELLDKPYVGCPVLASSAMMDKEIAKIIFDNAGIRTAKGVTLRKIDIETKIDECVEKIEKAFGYPSFIKPANMGSSVGISKAHDRDELISGLKDAAKYDEKILVEEFVKAKEIEVAVLGNLDPQASCPGMIVPCHEFYDYEAKYSTGDDSKIIIPAPLDEATTELIRTSAVKAFVAAGLRGLSRVDFFLTDDGQVILNEINTLPGFTNISMYPKLWGACGIEYTDLITKIIELGFERYELREALSFRKE